MSIFLHRVGFALSVVFVILMAVTFVRVEMAGSINSLQGRPLAQDFFFYFGFAIGSIGLCDLNRDGRRRRKGLAGFTLFGAFFALGSIPFALVSGKSDFVIPIVTTAMGCFSLYRSLISIPAWR